MLLTTPIPTRGSIRSACLKPAMPKFQTSATLVGGRNFHGELGAPTGGSAGRGHAKDGVYGMDLPTVDLERLEGDKRLAGTVLRGVSEVEIQQDHPDVRVDCRDAGLDARMLNDFLRFDVLAAGASTTGSRGMDAILDAVSVRGKRGVDLDEAADLQPLRVFHGNFDRFSARIDFRGWRDERHLLVALLIPRGVEYQRGFVVRHDHRFDLADLAVALF